MQRFVLHSKIHGARVTLADLNYVGSVTIDADLLEAADLLPNEKILVINLENGARFESYVFEGTAGSGIIGMNGGTARHCQVGDRVLIMSFAAVDAREIQSHVPHLVFVGADNHIESVKA
jgi:aspartate 1-decarboxylase